MAQFDVYINQNRETSKLFPYFVDIQNDLHSIMKTRVVIPLTPSMKPLDKLTPSIVIDGIKLVLSTSEITSIPISLCDTKVANIESCSSDIFDSLDFFIHGF